MKFFSRWPARLGTALLMGSALAGCCVVPVEPRAPRYSGAVVYEPAPVIVAQPVVVHRYGWGWRR